MFNKIFLYETWWVKEKEEHIWQARQKSIVYRSNVIYWFKNEFYTNFPVVIEFRDPGV